MNLKSVIFATTFCLISTTTVQAQETEIGYVKQGDHEILGSQYQTEVTIEEPGATFIKLHFKKLKLKPGAYITVSSADGSESYRYPENTKNRVYKEKNEWAFTIESSSVVVRLHASKLPGNVVRIDKWAVGVEPLSDNNNKSTCGSSDDYRRAACYESSNPTIYQRSEAVARLVIVKGNGTFTCTAWRVGPRNDTMITNNHCIGNQNHTSNTEVRFRHQHRSCSGDQQRNQVRVRANQMLVTNGSTDMTLFTINNPDRVSQFGYLELENRNLNSGETVYIPQHPSGWAKRIAVQNAGQDCRITSHSGKNAYHNCDTQGGSSGSPIISRSSHRVIALHNAAGCRANGGANHGNKVQNFYDLVSSHLGSTGGNNNGGNNGDGNNGGNNNGNGNDGNYSPDNPAPGCNSSHYIRCGDRCFTADQAASEPICQGNNNGGGNNGGGNNNGGNNNGGNNNGYTPDNPGPGCNRSHYIRCGDRCFTADQAASDPLCQ